MKVSIIGQGYVGLTIAIAASEIHDVIGFDTNKFLVEKLNMGQSHVEGIDSDLIKRRLNSRKYRATSNESDLDFSEVIVIAVPTPLTSDRKSDLSFIESACELIGKNVTNSALIINESTSYPGTLRNLIKPTIEKYSQANLSHYYAISPERVDPGRVDYNQKNTPRLYSGLNLEAFRKTREFYSSFCDQLVQVSSPEVAEAAKLFENTFRQVNIALVNEFSQICFALGIDVHEVINAANTKPYGFMKFNPGAGVGGHCIPVDPIYLAEIAESHGAPSTFIRLANEVNLGMAKYIVDRIKKDHQDNIRDKQVLIVGVAYKADVADVRETAAELVINYLKIEGAKVSWHDEIVSKWNTESSAPLSGADITIVLTMHSYLKHDLIVNSAPYVFDTTGKLTGAAKL